MISFFFRPAFSVPDKRTGVPYLKRISSIIRGEQIANYLGAKLNPTTGHENDISVHIKPLKMDKVKDGDYVDILDDIVIHNTLGTLIDRVKARPKVNAIAMTTVHKEWLEKLMPNKVVYIPHQHMNFERLKRTRSEVTTCGYIGMYVGSHEYACKQLKKELAKEGIKFIYLFTYPSREDVIKFYQSIDIQVIPFLNYLNYIPHYHDKKILDAMSFGIPTISEERLSYRDLNDFYIKIKSREEIIEKIKELQKGWDAERLINKAEERHISNVAKLYQQL